jgi:hypothetical protein
VRTSLQQMQRGTPTSISPKRAPSSAPGPLESSNPCRPQKLRLESKACLTRKGSRKRSRATLPPTRRIATFIPPHTLNFRVLPTNISSYAPVPLDADIEICKLRFRPWRPCPTRSTRLCRTSSSRSAKPRFSMVSFCAAIPPTNCAATFVSPPRCSLSGIANPSASLSFVQFWNASSNIASTSWPFSKISSATIPLHNACNSFANRSSFHLGSPQTSANIAPQLPFRTAGVPPALFPSFPYFLIRVDLCFGSENAQNRPPPSPIFVFITDSQRPHPVLHNYYKHLRSSLIV